MQTDLSDVVNSNIRIVSKEESDLAVLSFESNKQIPVVQISETMPKKGDRIAVISKPEGEKFVSTYGKIKSSKPENFSFDDVR